VGDQLGEFDDGETARTNGFEAPYCGVELGKLADQREALRALFDDKAVQSIQRLSLGGDAHTGLQP